MPLILTDQMIREATQVALELHIAFTSVLELPCVKDRRAATLAIELGVGRMTCQRIVKISKSPQGSNGTSPPGPELLANLPGVNGLRQFLDAVVKAGVSQEQLAAAYAAVDAFDSFLREIDQSQTAFASALLLHQQGSDPDRQRARREDLFDAASVVTGQSAETTISMMAIRPRPTDTKTFEQIVIRGYAGMRASGSAMPIRLPINMAYTDFRNVTGEEAARQPQKLVEEFCTRPLPTIDTRVIKSEHLAHIINPEHIPTGEPFDCFAMQNTEWTFKEVGRQVAIWLYIDYPTRHCTFDLHLHRSMDSTLEISADCHLWGTSLLAPPEDLWMTRFADQIQFTELGSGLEYSASEAYTRQKELTLHLFKEHGWDPSEFVGYRCEMELPVWRSAVCLIMTGR